MMGSGRSVVRRNSIRRRAAIAFVLATAVGACTSTGSENGTENAVEVAGPDDAPGGSSNDAAVWRSTTVVDGDTLYVAGSAGELEVRVIGVNTPESGECFFDEATDALADLVEGTDLVLVADRSDVDQFGRALRYVETVDGVDVGAALVEGGFAIARRYPPDDARADAYAALQREARRAGRGLWASDACGAGDVDDVDIGVEVNADAPGDDGENLNGEWVVFTNLGAAPVDLDGWEVADESASHRYEFADLRLAAGAEVSLLSGCGRDDDTTRHWCASGSAIWNNSGDTVFLRDANGNIVVAYSYGDSG